MNIDSPQAFAETLRDMSESGTLREDRLRAMKQVVMKYTDVIPWMREFLWLIYMPEFFNIGVVDGACNCDCRMCSAGRGLPFQYWTIEKMETALRHAPTVSRITLSAVNSEPLLNPDLCAIIRLCAARRCGIDFYTNGLALNDETAHVIVRDGAVSMMNFSMDAATEHTYRTIRRRSLARVRANIEKLVELKRKTGARRPHISISLVEMSDNIEELPDLVDYAASVGAFRVFVEALINPNPENHSATENPDWPDAVREAKIRAARHRIRLELQLKLTPPPLPNTAGAPEPETPAPPPESALAPASACSKAEPHSKTEPASDQSNLPPWKHPWCTWLDSAWVSIKGDLAPCCIVFDVPMGNILDGPLQDNKLYIVQKMKLHTGNIFPSCLKHADVCAFLSERKNRMPLRDLVVEPLNV
jgi:MoaA/NifB/PqqE/SkfB family radical SAM enzyme